MSINCSFIFKADVSKAVSNSNFGIRNKSVRGENKKRKKKGFHVRRKSDRTVNLSSFQVCRKQLVIQTLVFGVRGVRGVRGEKRFHV